MHKVAAWEGCIQRCTVMSGAGRSMHGIRARAGGLGVCAGTSCAAGTVRECRGGVAPLSQGALTGQEVQDASAASAQDSTVLVCSPRLTV